MTTDAKTEILLTAFEQVARDWDWANPPRQPGGILRRAAELCEIPFAEAEALWDAWEATVSFKVSS